MTNTITILGSTGSIGRQSLDVAEQLGLSVAALTANTNVERMEAQCRKFRPKLAVMTDEGASRELTMRLADTDIKVRGGLEALSEAAALPEADTVVTAVVGVVGLKPTLAAIHAGKRIALANKETLVCAGELVMDEAERCGAEIVPVDSEHSAIFQCLQGCAERSEIKRLILTCSGGPFRGMKREEAAVKTREDALRHPNWTMGPKITVDCATLMNKGLEVIEAMRLYRLPLRQVSVVVHPQSIVHSAVEYEDGAIIAQMGEPDMRIPIQYALTYPKRVQSPFPRIDFSVRSHLTFEKPDLDTFRCLSLAYCALKTGGTMPAVLNGANEIAVARFLKGELTFLQIPSLIERTMDAYTVKYKYTLEDLLEADAWARAYAQSVRF